MSSDLEFVKYAVGQINSDKEVRYRAMFGGYTVYCNDKVVGLIGDNQLFIKITDQGIEFVGNIQKAPPYPGAKLAFLIEEQLEDVEWLSQLVNITEHSLPTPKPKKKKKST